MGTDGVSRMGLPKKNTVYLAQQRFRMLEMQALLIVLVENFEFSPTEVDIIRVFAGVSSLGSIHNDSSASIRTATMTCMIKGQNERGTQMPLVVTPLQ